MNHTPSHLSQGERSHDTPNYIDVWEFFTYSVPKSPHLSQSLIHSHLCFSFPLLSPSDSLFSPFSTRFPTSFLVAAGDAPWKQRIRDAFNKIGCVSAIPLPVAELSYQHATPLHPSFSARETVFEKDIGFILFYLHQLQHVTKEQILQKGNIVENVDIVEVKRKDVFEMFVDWMTFHCVQFDDVEMSLLDRLHFTFELYLPSFFVIAHFQALYEIYVVASGNGLGHFSDWDSSVEDNDIFQWSDFCSKRTCISYQLQVDKRAELCGLWNELKRTEKLLSYCIGFEYVILNSLKEKGVVF